MHGIRLFTLLARGRHFRGFTAKNATDLLQVVDFTSLLQVVNKLHQDY